MWGCSRLARMSRSREKRCSRSLRMGASAGSLSATRRLKAPCAREREPPGALEGAARARGEPHLGHAAAAEQSDELIRSDACTRLQAAHLARFLAGAEQRERRLALIGAAQKRFAQRQSEIPIGSGQGLEPAAPARLV